MVRRGKHPTWFNWFIWVFIHHCIVWLVSVFMVLLLYYSCQGGKCNYSLFKGTNWGSDLCRTSGTEACSWIHVLYCWYGFILRHNHFKWNLLNIKLLKLAHAVCVFCTTGNKGIGLSFPDYSCCLTGEKDRWYTQASWRSSCSRMGSTEDLLQLKTSPGGAELLFLHMSVVLCWVFSPVLVSQGVNRDEGSSIRDMGWIALITNQITSGLLINLRLLSILYPP